MKTAVSIPDELFARADAVAKRQGKSRSQVYREALSEYVMRRETQSVTDAMNEVVDAVGAPADGWVEAVGRRMLERTEW